MASVVMKNVMKRYENNVLAVRDFNMCINDREFIVFVGPSGSGKTTALRMIAGLEEITAGEIYFDDLMVNNLPPKDRDIAMVFQNYALYPHMTVYENMSFALRLKKTPKDEIRKRVSEAAAALSIEDLLNRKPRELSGGQRQRVALGRAIVRKPRLFLMDEPLSNLDAKLRIQMRAEISKLHHQLQTTFIYVTHDQTEAMTMGDRIVVMNEGFIQQIDSPQRLYEQPANLFVAGFIGSPPMNLEEAVVLKHDEEVHLKLGNSYIKLLASQGKKIEELGYLGKSVIMGIRPEGICEQAAFKESLPDNVLPVQVEVVERLGAETLLHVRIEDIDFISRTGPETSVRAGDRINLVFDPGKIHLFDNKNKRTIVNAL